MISLIFTLLVCTICGWAVKKAGLPGGIIIGSIIGASALHILTPYGYMPKAAKFIAQVTTGAYVGSLFNRSQLHSIRHVWKSYIMVMVCFTAANFTAGLLIWETGTCDLLTSLLCCVPGGMSDTPLIAAEMGADVGTVAILQFVRMFTGVAILPSVIAWLIPVGNSTTANSVGTTSSNIHNHIVLPTIITLLIAFLGGYMGKCSKIPAGTLIGSMVSVIFLNLISGKAHLPLPIKRGAQILSGAYIGCTLTAASLLQLRSLLLPAGIILAVYIPSSLLCGWLMSKVLKKELREAMLCCTPGGASDMALIASDLGVESTTLIVTQILRMVTVILLFPQLIYQFCRFMGQS